MASAVLPWRDTRPVLENRDVEAPVLTAPEWVEVERLSLRAQALAELRALSERELGREAPPRTIRLP